MLLYLMTSAARGHWPTFVCCMVCHQIAAAPLTFLLLGSHQGGGICVLRNVCAGLHTSLGYCLLITNDAIKSK